MDKFNFRPSFSPIIDGSPCKFSVGMYRGKKRIIVAWFIDENSANDYLIRCRRDNPFAMFDCIQSLF